MSQVGQEGQTWPGGLTYVFQGTVAEDATAGTHVCTATVTPGVGNEMQLIGLRIVVGTTATAQLVDAYVTDGTNRIMEFYFGSDTTSGRFVSLPTNTTSATGNVFGNGLPGPIVSGTMVLVLSVTTAAVSVTHTFSVECRIHGQKPTVVLNDTIGTSTNTVNTDAVF